MFRSEVDPDFEEEVPPAPRRRTLLIVAILVLFGGAGAALWAGYRYVVGHEGGGVPTLRADPRPTKVRPDNPGGAVVPDQDKVVLNQQRGSNPQVEQLLPPPETPIPRPAPSPPAATPPVPTTPPAAAATSPPPAVAAAPPPPAAAPAVAALPAPPAALPSSPPTRAAAGAYRVQIGALHGEAEAQREGERQKHVHADLLGKLAVSVARADLGEKGIYYRILLGPLPDEAHASQLCGELRQLKVGCILVKP